MKISERKQHLRARGVVPVSQETTAHTNKVVSTPARGAARTTASGKAPAKPPRSRWQPSPGYQLAFGIAYVVFAPFLIYQNLVVLPRLHPKSPPGAFDVLLPVIFLLFGLWWIYRGLQARRRKNAAADDVAATTTKTRLVKGSPR